MDQIVDYSYGRPAPADIAASYVGAMRYLGWDNRCLTPRERDALFAGGVPIGLIWETTANRTLSGAAGGREDATKANQLADQLGFPTSVPIFGVAIDFDATDAQVRGPITDYARAGAAAGPRPWDMYGKYAAVETLVGGGVVARGWQCCAWSPFGTGTGGSIISGGESRGRVVSRHSSMFQRLGYVLNNTCDANDVLKPIDWLYHPTLEDDMYTEDQRKADIQVTVEATAQRVAQLLTNVTDGSPAPYHANLTQILASVDALPVLVGGAPGPGVDTAAILTAIRALPAEVIAELKAAL